jgi:glycosyltransferase A (GT-A) superfamily protein (DUF2064 family)
VTSTRRAVVLFERDLASEAREKRVPRAVLQRLRQRLEAQIAQLPDADPWIVTSDRTSLRLQHGRLCYHATVGSLTEQLRFTSSTLQALGYEEVVFLAADLALSTSVLLKTLDALGREGDRVVIGDSPDGGFYLFGYRQSPGFDWADIALGTPEASSTLRARTRDLGREVVDVEEIEDLDSQAQLPAFLGNLQRRGFVALARELTALLRRVLVAPPRIAPGSLRPAGIGLRAPPSL